MQSNTGQKWPSTSITEQLIYSSLGILGSIQTGSRHAICMGILRTSGRGRRPSLRWRRSSKEQALSCPCVWSNTEQRLRKWGTVDSNPEGCLQKPSSPRPVQSHREVYLSSKNADSPQAPLGPPRGISLGRKHRCKPERKGRARRPSIPGGRPGVNDLLRPWPRVT